MFTIVFLNKIHMSIKLVVFGKVSTKVRGYEHSSIGNVTRGINNISRY